MQRALVVFVKVPGLGIAKSRIADAHGSETAEKIHNELLQSSGLLMERFRPHVFFAGALEPGRLRQEYRTAQTFVAQKGATLGERMANAAVHLFKQAYAGVVLVGSDCPEMTSADIDQAFECLERGDDIVFGPATDGGYYLIGVRQGREAVFSIQKWSRPDVLAESIAIVKDRGWRYELVSTRSDIDTMEDYRAWKARTGAASAQG